MGPAGEAEDGHHTGQAEAPLRGMGGSGSHEAVSEKAWLFCISQIILINRGRGGWEETGRGTGQ